ncbi:MAG: hypothetical protein NC389_17990 [Acetatifactor muris]|nr:hypothetical protein [Acetatifactor muris]
MRAAWQQSADVPGMEVLTMEEHKIFYTVEDIAADLGMDRQQAGQIVNDLTERLRAKGILTVRGAVQKSYYLQMKESGFLSDDGAGRDDRPLTEKRLLCLKEFCIYSSLGQHAARKLAAEIGIERRIGHKVLYDRAAFDRWCDSCSVASEGRGDVE